MNNIIESGLIDQVKSPESIEKTQIYEFVNNNKNLFKNLLEVEYEIYDLITKAESIHHMIGAMVKNNMSKEVDALKKKEDEVLDLIIENLNNVGGIKIISSREQLDDALDAIMADELTDKNNVDENSENESMFLQEESFNGYYPDIYKKIKEKVNKEKNYVVIQSKNKKKNNNKAILDKEVVRLNRVRKLLEVETVDKDGDHSFDPQKRLLEIKQNANGDKRNKRESLEEYKNELNEQFLGMGKINAFLESEILENEEVDLGELYMKFQEKANEYRLSQWQIKRYDQVFKELEKAMAEIKRVIDMHKNEPESRVFESLNGGIKCNGKIKIEYNKIAVIFYVNDRDDYARVVSCKGNGEKLTKEDYRMAKESKGFHREGMIFINNVKEIYLATKKNTIEHEIKHMINKIIAGGLSGAEYYMKEYIDKNNNAKNLEQYFNNELLLALFRAKDEILAYLKTGENIDDIEDRLFMKNGSYDYLSKQKYLKSYNEDEILEDYSQREIFNKLPLFQEKYQRILRTEMETVGNLDDFGFTTKEIIGIFQSEPITKWKKLYERLRESPAFLKGRKERIEKKIEDLKKELENISKELIEYRRDRSFLKRKVYRIIARLPFNIYRHFGEESFMELELEYKQNEMQAKLDRLYNNLSKMS